jgi:hypothetical protein
MEVTVADNNSVHPLGIIYAEVAIGPSVMVIPLVVFPQLPVPVLLGTDWLTQSGAINDWKNQLLTFHGSEKVVKCRTVHPFDVSSLHLTSHVVVPPRAGVWAEVATGKNSPLIKFAKAIVMTAIDPWTAENRSVTSPNALAHIEYGRTKVFLVNTSEIPVKLNVGKSVALACPGIPQEKDLVPFPVVQYDMASTSEKRGGA